MNIVVIDAIPLNPGDNPWDPIAALGSLTVHERCQSEDIVSRAAEADILLVNKARITAEHMAALPRLRYIGTLSTGYDGVDVRAAAEKGIVVCNVPAYGAESVAQHAMALLLELCRRVGLHDASVRAGDWTKRDEWCYWLTPQVELFGKTLGIIGLGHIGRRVGELGRAFGMRVIAHSQPTDPAPDWPEFKFVDRDTLFRESDVISMHCPLFSETHEIVNAHTLSLMPAGAMVINTARGPLVNEQDMAKALHEGRIAGFATDVLSQEPVNPDNPILNAPNTIITPHIAWAAVGARRNIVAITAGNIAAFQNGTPRNVVNGVVPS